MERRLDSFKSAAGWAGLGQAVPDESPLHQCEPVETFSSLIHIAGPERRPEMHFTYFPNRKRKSSYKSCEIPGRRAALG